MKQFLIYLLILGFCTNIYSQTLSSPNNQIILSFELENGIPTYRLSYKGKEVIKKSRLGFELVDDEPLLDNFETLSTSTSNFDETWEPVWGEYKEIRNHHNELEVQLKQRTTERVITLRFRLFNDGLGFRYEFPEQKNLN